MLRNQKGQGLVEYSLILALIAIAAILVITNMGDSVARIFDDIAQALSGI
jgi:pilus assembly protein Flp/PilA